MSYEGHEVWCCNNGHISYYDCYEAPSDESLWQCHCGAKVYGIGYVDETNGLPYSLRFYIRHIGNLDGYEVYSFIHTLNRWDCENGEYIFEQWERLPSNVKSLEL